MKTFIILMGLISAMAQGSTDECDKQLPKILKDYKKAGKLIRSYAVKDCSTVTTGMAPVFNENTNSNAPRVKKSNACVIILRPKKGSLDDLAVYDTLNKFSLVRSFNNPKESFSPSRFGDEETGTILFIKNEGKKRASDQDFITRATYDQREDQVRLVKWKVGWFFNKYSHDYSLQCQ